MSSYEALAGWYDAFTEDVPYDEFVKFYKEQFQNAGGDFSLLLDLCCGTGSLLCRMAKEGYDVIGVDASEDMLMEARNKAIENSISPMLLCQNAEELDLYGTVDACYSALDSINYIPPESVGSVFRRLHYFIRPDGLLIFDIRSIDWMKRMNGSTSVDETDDALCLWRSDFDEETGEMTYGMDLFSRQGKLWERDSEFHTEYAYSTEQLTSLLLANGYDSIKTIFDGPQGKIGRVFMVARRIPIDGEPY